MGDSVGVSLAAVVVQAKALRHVQGSSLPSLRQIEIGGKHILMGLL